MNSLRVLIVTPAAPGSRHGNRVTALRWAGHLRALGHEAEVALEWDGHDCDVLVALHARRSHGAIHAWKSTHPALPLALVLTGTDLYRDIRSDADARASLRLADRLVVLQPRGVDELTPAQRAKTGVIFQSVRTLQRRAPPRSYFLVTVIGHLRDEKDPFRAARALAHLPQRAIRVVQLGQAMTPETGREARAIMRAEPRYRWLGELDHAGAMRWLARSHAMVISSRMEGGAHVVSEAIAMGVPVIASAIRGNIGLLGEDYPGYYPFGNEVALAALLARAQSDPAWLATLEAAVRARARQVDPATERAAIDRLIADLIRGRKSERTRPPGSIPRSYVGVSMRKK
ncbi:MAG: TIGR04348 family glycosyltransferase [Betaproteobacteria bacterium]|nr:MAG: TIGR04348 family glycosyltransferase [Betaproteobacteria bacterium]